MLAYKRIGQAADISDIKLTIGLLSFFLPPPHDSKFEIPFKDIMK